MDLEPVTSQLTQVCTKCHGKGELNFWNPAEPSAEDSIWPLATLDGSEAPKTNSPRLYVFSVVEQDNPKRDPKRVSDRKTAWDYDYDDYDSDDCFEPFEPRFRKLLSLIQKDVAPHPPWLQEAQEL